VLAESADSPVAEGSSSKATLLDVVRLPFIMASAAFWMNENVFMWLLVGPLIAATWRTRRHLADATAVQLTRYPDGLSGALARLATRDDVIAGARWSSHLFIVGKKAARYGSSIAGQQALQAMRQQTAGMSRAERIQFVQTMMREGMQASRCSESRSPSICCSSCRWLAASTCRSVLRCPTGSRADRPLPFFPPPLLPSSPSSLLRELLTHL
jgi:hypothetical protein